jgi:sulfur-carrier protein
MTLNPATPLRTIHVTLKLFSVYQEAYGQSEQVFQCPVGCTIAQLHDRLIAEHPHLEQWRSVTRFGVNLTFVPAETMLQDGDEVVLIPPVSGG